MELGSFDQIEINDLEVRCIVGLFPREKLEAQPLHLNLRLYLDTKKAAKSSLLSQSIDYAGIANQARFILQAGRFKLIETAAEVLAANIIASRYCENSGADLKAVWVSIAKPKALEGQGVPKISILRSDSDFLYQSLVPGSLEHVVFRGSEHMILRQEVPPLTDITLSKPPLLSISDFFVGFHWKQNSHALDGNCPVVRRPGANLVYRNHSKHTASIITIVGGAYTNYQKASIRPIQTDGRAVLSLHPTALD